MSILTALDRSVSGSVGACANGDGTYRLDLADGTARAATPAELLRAAHVQAHAQRRARRTQAELAGFSHQGHPLDSDRDSILRIANAAASALSAILTQQPWATTWRCADETDLPLDAPGMLALQGALAYHGQACHSASQAIAADIDAATTVEQVEAILAATPTDPRWPA